jgi:hypothetical protein
MLRNMLHGTMMVGSLEDDKWMRNCCAYYPQLGVFEASVLMKQLPRRRREAESLFVG